MENISFFQPRDYFSFILLNSLNSNTDGGAFIYTIIFISPFMMINLTTSALTVFSNIWFYSSHIYEMMIFFEFLKKWFVFLKNFIFLKLYLWHAYVSKRQEVRTCNTKKCRKEEEKKTVLSCLIISLSHRLMHMKAAVIIILGFFTSIT